MTTHKPLTINQVTALSELHTRGNLARSALMMTIGIGHNTMAALVEALEFHGYVIDGETHSGTHWKLLSITMAGRRALWLPGTDHAGFETQIVYERKLEKEQPKVRSERYQQVSSSVADYAKKLAEFKKPTYKREDAPPTDTKPPQG